jgi:hypothetical protein
MEKRRDRGRVALDETFDEFLQREGVLAEAEELALKEIVVDQIRAVMKERGLARTAMAERTNTDRQQ